MFACLSRAWLAWLVLRMPSSQGSRGRSEGERWESIMVALGPAVTMIHAELDFLGESAVIYPLLPPSARAEGHDVRAARYSASSRPAPPCSAELGKLRERAILA